MGRREASTPAALPLWARFRGSILRAKRAFVNAAIQFEPDAYLLTGPKLMGRQSAGAGFLRAAVQARGDGPVTAYTPFDRSAEIFRRTVAEIDPTAQTRWIPGKRLDLLAQNGLLYRPDHILGGLARQRLRVGPAAYSLCGVTHTLATDGPLDSIAKMLTDPVMPWDALVCTSTAARAVVTAVLDRQTELQRWRTGCDVVAERPLLPIIPLGVHCDDFTFTEPEKSAARDALAVGRDAVVVLVAGRISIHSKAHPYPLMQALQHTAEETGKPIVLVFAGKAATPAISEAFSSGAQAFCPDVRTLFVDGQDAAAYRGAWAAADLFASLADSIQETFGITPLEAMAAGLPALVSDWNGYKDTVRDGVDGFRIDTWAPPPGAGGAIARDFESGLIGYDDYLSRASTAVTVDMRQLLDRLRDLVTDADLRRRLGAAGQARARSTFDWAVVFRSYQLLWSEQESLRRAATADPATAGWLARAPRRGADHMGPFDTFADYPSRHVGPGTWVSAVSDIGPQAYRELIAQPLLAVRSVRAEIADRVLAALRNGSATVVDLGRATGLAPLLIAEVVARLAKIDVVALTADRPA
jgi:glycosyltransferase involved in cell wall biosynthesis